MAVQNLPGGKNRADVSGQAPAALWICDKVSVYISRISLRGQVKGTARVGSGREGGIGQTAIQGIPRGTA